MFDTIRRVISGDNVTGSNRDIHMEAEEDRSDDMRTAVAATPTAPTGLEAAMMESLSGTPSSPALIETEHHPPHHHHHHHHHYRQHRQHQAQREEAAMDVEGEMPMSEQAYEHERRNEDFAMASGASSLSTVSTQNDSADYLSRDVDFALSRITIDTSKNQASILTRDGLRPISDAEVEALIRSKFPRNDSKMSIDSSSGSNRASSQTSSRDWGWFEDVHMSDQHGSSPYFKRKDQAQERLVQTKGAKSDALDGNKSSSPSPHIQDIIQPTISKEAAAMAVTAPTYVLEESISSQQLWKVTAGNRPPQPAEERAFFEMMWAQNFERSEVDYKLPVGVLTAASPLSLCPFTDGNFDNDQADDLARYTMPADARANPGTTDVAEATLISRLNDPASNAFNETVVPPSKLVAQKTVKGTGDDGDLMVTVRGDNEYGTTVSKSFARSTGKGGPILGVDTVNISVCSYRVVESKKHGKYAQFLVIYREGSIRDTIGVWKRYSDFVELANQVTHAHEGCAAVIANISPLAVAEEHEVEHLPNAITSWRLLKKRQRWFRCLDSEYLSLKVFLLERFLHDILFESTSPTLLRHFVSDSIKNPEDEE